MKYLYLVWSNLKRKKVRTTLTFLSVFVAFVLFSYMAAIETALEFGVSVVGADRLVIRHKVSLIQPLPLAYESRMEAIDGVVEATHATWFGGVYQDPTNFFMQAPVNPTEYLSMYPEFLLPEDQLEAWLSTRTGAVAGRAIADQFGWEIGDRIPIQPTIWFLDDPSAAWEFELVGIYDGAESATDTTQFLFRYDYFDEARTNGKGLVGWYYVRVDDPDQAAEIANAIDAEFANSPAETSAETELAFVQGFANQIGNISKIMTGILSAVFFTILLVAGNTMAQSVRERIEEIGVLKAIGYTHRQVLGLVLGESCLLAGVAGLAGLALAYWAISVRGDPTGGAFPVFFMPPADLAVGLALAATLGVAAGALPALQAMRLQVAEALRRK